jgi:hypothetical protein
MALLVCIYIGCRQHLHQFCRLHSTLTTHCVDPRAFPLHVVPGTVHHTLPCLLAAMTAAMLLGSPWTAQWGLAECSHPAHSGMFDSSFHCAALQQSGGVGRQHRHLLPVQSDSRGRTCGASAQASTSACPTAQGQAAQQHYSLLEGRRRSVQRCVASRAAAETASRAAADPSAELPVGQQLDSHRDGNGAHAERSSNGAPGRQQAAAGTSVSGHADAPVAPEDFQLAAGELSAIDRDSACSPADVFRCTACVEPACQVRACT